MSSQMSAMLKLDLEGWLMKLLHESMVTTSRLTKLIRMATLNGQAKVEEKWLRTSIRVDGRKVEKSSPIFCLPKTRDNLIPGLSWLSFKESIVMSSMENSRLSRCSML